MKIQLDTNSKSISIEGDHEISEIIKNLNKLLPNNEWKKWKLKMSSPMTYWVTNPIPIHYWINTPYVYPFIPTYIPYVYPPQTINILDDGHTTTVSCSDSQTVSFNNTQTINSNVGATCGAQYNSSNTTFFDPKDPKNVWNYTNDSVDVNIELDNFGKIPSNEGVYCIEC